MTIPNIWKNKTCSKPPTSLSWEKHAKSTKVHHVHWKTWGKNRGSPVHHQLLGSGFASVPVGPYNLNTRRRAVPCGFSRFPTWQEDAGGYTTELGRVDHLVGLLEATAMAAMEQSGAACLILRFGYLDSQVLATVSIRISNTQRSPNIQSHSFYQNFQVFRYSFYQNFQ